jgi:hypothetical protein
MDGLLAAHRTRLAEAEWMKVGECTAALPKKQQQINQELRLDCYKGKP